MDQKDREQETGAMKTTELWAKLFSASTIDDYLNEVEAGALPVFSEYLQYLCRERGLRPAEVLKAGDVEPSYGHRVFSGGRRPSRDKILQLAFGFGLNVEETQQLLTVGRCSALHPKVKRDALIAFGLNGGLSITSTQIMLEEHGLPLLGSPKRQW